MNTMLYTTIIYYQNTFLFNYSSLQPMVSFRFTITPVCTSLLVDMFPNFIETNSGLETIRNDQRHGYMCNDIPSQHSVKVHLIRMRNGTIVF